MPLQRPLANSRGRELNKMIGPATYLDSEIAYIRLNFYIPEYGVLGPMSNPKKTKLLGFGVWSSEE